MSVRTLFTIAFCLVSVITVGCKPQPPAEVEETAPPAEEMAAAAEAPEPAAEAPSSGTCLKGKVMAVNMAAEAKDLAKMQAAAEEACAAVGKHQPMDAELGKKPEFQKMHACAVAAIKKVAAAKTADEAATAAAAIMGTCKACHMVYKPKPAAKAPSE